MLAMIKFKSILQSDHISGQLTTILSTMAGGKIHKQRIDFKLYHFVQNSVDPFNQDSRGKSD